MAFIETPYMGLIAPGIGTQPSPTWAENVNDDFNKLDSHDHSLGKGFPISPSGMNISSDLSFSGNNAILLRSTRFDNQSGALVDASDLSCAYSVGDDGDLYYNDGIGNQIQITANGGVAGSPGSIANLTSPASAAFVSGTSTFVWKSTASLNANMDAATLIVRYPGSYPTPAGNYIAIQAPSSLASGYSITLPALPVATSFMTMTNMGVMAGSIATANGITRANLAALGQQISSSCGDQTISSSSPTDITNLTVTITSTGRPIKLFLQPDGTSNPGRINVDSTATSYDLFLLRDGVLRAVIRNYTPGMPAFLFEDTPTGGTYVYKMQAAVVTGATISPRYMCLVGYEEF